MHMVVMYYYTITKIQLLTRKCKKVILNICFVTWKNKEKRGTQKEANDQTDQYQGILSSKTYVSEDKLAKY